MTAAKVLAPLVLVKNQRGEIGYHYRGAIISWLSDEDYDRLLGDGMVCAAVAPVVPVSEPGEPPTVAVPRPAKAHAKELWVDYAVSKGWDRAVAEETNKKDLVAALTDGDDSDDGDEDPADTADVTADGQDPDEIPVPKKAGLLEDWQAYARAKGLPDADIEGMEKQELIELLT